MASQPFRAAARGGSDRTRVLRKGHRPLSILRQKLQGGEGKLAQRPPPPCLCPVWLVPSPREPVALCRVRGQGLLHPTSLLPRGLPRKLSESQCRWQSCPPCLPGACRPWAIALAPATGSLPFSCLALVPAWLSSPWPPSPEGPGAPATAPFWAPHFSAEEGAAWL